jgi:hypothetical protein
MASRLQDQRASVLLAILDAEKALKEIPVNVSTAAILKTKNALESVVIAQRKLVAWMDTQLI